MIAAAMLAAGVPDADMVLVAFSDHPICRDTGTLWYAQAKYCDYDPETGRPTLGGMLVCPNFFRIESTAGRVESLVHEAFHGLVRARCRELLLAAEEELLVWLLHHMMMCL
jgi:hypothetical protein